MLSSVLLCVLVAAALSTMFGGPFRTVIVAGESMLPTYDPGDVLFTWRQSSSEPGDVVVFKVPDSSSVADGRLVVHRVVDVSAAGYVTRGDNNDRVDPWTPTDGDVVGSPVLRIPHGSWALRLLHSTWVFALAVMVLVTVLLWPHDDESDTGPSRAAPTGTGPDGDGPAGDDATPEPSPCV